MKARSILMIIVMFAVMAVPAMAATNNAEIYHSYDGALGDLTGNGYSGSLSGTAAVQTSVFKVGNGSVYFDGNTANSLEMNNYSSTIATHNAGTISLWLRPMVSSSEYWLGIGALGSTTNRFEMGFFANGSGFVRMHANSGSAQIQANPNSNGFYAAYLDAQWDLHEVLFRLTQIIKLTFHKRYTQWVFNTHIVPLDWGTKYRIVEIFLDNLI